METPLTRSAVFNCWSIQWHLLMCNAILPGDNDNGEALSENSSSGRRTAVGDILDLQILKIEQYPQPHPRTGKKKDNRMIGHCLKTKKKDIKIGRGKTKNTPGKLKWPDLAPDASLALTTFLSCLSGCTFCTPPHPHVRGKGKGNITGIRAMQGLG